MKRLLHQIQLKLYLKRSISVTALITKYQQKYQCYSIKKKIYYLELNAVFPFGFQLNSKSLNSCFSSEPGHICKIQTCQEAKLNKTRFGFSRRADVKGTINNASQNPKPSGWVWEVGKSLRILRTREAAALSKTSFSRSPGSAGNSCKSGKTNKTDQTKILTKLFQSHIQASCLPTDPLPGSHLKLSPTLWHIKAPIQEKSHLP